MDHEDYFVTQEFDVTKVMYEFQCSILRQKWKLSLEDHIHHAMAVNSILLLSPNKYPDALSPHFYEASLRTTMNKFSTIYELNLPDIRIETVTSMISIICELDIKVINRSQAIVKLQQLVLLPYEHKFANGLVELVKRLPRVPIEEDANESELITRLIDPFLCGLFDDPEESGFVRWTNDIAVEAQKYETSWTCRPDLIVTSLKGVNECLRRTKLGWYSWFANHRTIHYFLSLGVPSEGLYIMYELRTLQLPKKLCDISKLVMDIPLAQLVLDVFHRLCIRSVKPFQPAQHRPTVSESHFDGIFSSSMDRKRSCHLMKYN